MSAGCPPGGGCGKRSEPLGADGRYVLLTFIPGGYITSGGTNGMGKTE
jgi:hypothetical protein